MQQLASKNYDYVEVYVKEIEVPYRLNVQGGLALMDYLADPTNKGSHVMLNDLDGNKLQVISYDIRRVVPHQNINEREQIEEALKKWQ